MSLVSDSCLVSPRCTRFAPVKWRLQPPSYIIMTASSVSASLILFPLTISHSGFALLTFGLIQSQFLIIFLAAIFPTALPRLLCGIGQLLTSELIKRLYL